MPLFLTSLAPAKARFNPELEGLKQRFRFLLHRDLTAKEENWLELSAPLLPLADDEPAAKELFPPSRKIA